MNLEKVHHEERIVPLRDLRGFIQPGAFIELGGQCRCGTPEASFALFFRFLTEGAHASISTC